eukprot:6188353-Pleurochrysis_carterae.AAC.3
MPILGSAPPVVHVRKEHETLSAARAKGGKVLRTTDACMHAPWAAHYHHKLPCTASVCRPKSWQLRVTMAAQNMPEDVSNGFAASERNVSGRQAARRKITGIQRFSLQTIRIYDGTCGIREGPEPARRA